MAAKPTSWFTDLIIFDLMQLATKPGDLTNRYIWLLDVLVDNHGGDRQIDSWSRKGRSWRYLIYLVIFKPELYLLVSLTRYKLYVQEKDRLNIKQRGTDDGKDCLNDGRNRHAQMTEKTGDKGDDGKYHDLVGISLDWLIY